MRKLIFISLLLFILLNSTFVKSQTKGDSQIWIKSTIENYVNRDKYRLLNVYYFDEGTSFTIVTMVNSVIHYEKMNMSDITQVIIRKTPTDYELRLGCKYDKAYCCETGIHEVNDNGSVSIAPSDEYKTGITVYLDKSLQYDDMVARLKKALTHLITLNGGTIKTETF